MLLLSECVLYYVCAHLKQLYVFFPFFFFFLSLFCFNVKLSVFVATSKHALTCLWLIMEHDLNTVSVFSSKQNPGVKMLYKCYFLWNKRTLTEFLYKALRHVNEFWLLKIIFNVLLVVLRLVSSHGHGARKIHLHRTQ
jgi:hypothetical protein